jgi:GT2 family glycosyltransferase
MSRANDAMASSQAETPIVAFVVPVRDDAERLRTCLRSLRHAAAAAVHDVLVLDHGSRDQSGEVAREIGARVLTRHGGNVAALRNLGAAETTAPLIAFVDADNEVAAGWLDSAIAAFATPTVGIAGAPYSAPPDGTWVQRTYDALRRHPTSNESTEWLGAGNMVVRREAFVRIGGFDERLETCEDVDLCARAAAAGWDVLAVRGMQSVHHGDPARLSNVFWGELWRGRDNLRVTLRGPRSFRTVASAAMPIAYAAALVAMLLGGFAAWPIGPLLAAAGLVSLLGLVGIRVAAMRRNAGGRWPAGLWAALRVAVAYDLGRSAAVFVGVGHGRRREAVRQ